MPCRSSLVVSKCRLNPPRPNCPMAQLEWIFVILAAAGAAWWVIKRGLARAEQADGDDRPWKRRAFSQPLAPDDPAAAPAAGFYFRVRFPETGMPEREDLIEALQGALIEARLGRVWEEEDSASDLGVLVNEHEDGVNVVLGVLKEHGAPEGTVVEEFEPEPRTYTV